MIEIQCVVVHIELPLPRKALYTALSRVKTPFGLFIIGNIKLSSKISEKYQFFEILCG